MKLKILFLLFTFIVIASCDSTKSYSFKDELVFTVDQRFNLDTIFSRHEVKYFDTSDSIEFLSVTFLKKADYTTEEIQKVISYATIIIKGRYYEYTIEKTVIKNKKDYYFFTTKIDSNVWLYQIINNNLVVVRYSTKNIRLSINTRKRIVNSISKSLKLKMN